LTLDARWVPPTVLPHSPCSWERLGKHRVLADLLMTFASAPSRPDVAVGELAKRLASKNPTVTRRPRPGVHLMSRNPAQRYPPGAPLRAMPEIAKPLVKKRRAAIARDGVATGEESFKHGRASFLVVRGTTMTKRMRIRKLPQRPCPMSNKNPASRSCDSRRAAIYCREGKPAIEPATPRKRKHHQGTSGCKRRQRPWPTLSTSQQAHSYRRGTLATP